MKRKITTVVLAWFMALYGLIAAPYLVKANGAEEGTGSITITNAQSDVEYAAYQIFGASYATDGNGQTIGVSYIANEKTKSILEGYHQEGQPACPFVFTPTSDGHYAVTVRVGIDTSIVTQFFNEFTDNIIRDFADEKHDGIAKTDQEHTVVFSDLPYGYYFVTSSSGATVTLTTAAPNASIIEKTQRPVIDRDAKKVKVGDSWADWTGTTVGDVREFKISYSASNYINETPIREYTLTDTASNLQIDPDTIVLQIGETNIPYAEFGTHGITCTIDGGVTTVKIPWVNEEGQPLYRPAPVDVLLTYSARVLKPAATNGATNTVTIAYNDFVVESTVNLATYSFKLNKYDKTSYENQAPVQVNGAKFTLWDAAEAGNQIYVESNGTGGFNVIGKGEENKNDVLIEAGMTNVYGLNAGTYYLQEETAPDGYNRLTSRVEVQVTKATEEPGNVVDVLNARGSMLPGTGEGGRAWLFETALILSAIGIILLLFKKHQESKRQS